MNEVLILQQRIAELVTHAQESELSSQQRIVELELMVAQRDELLIQKDELLTQKDKLLTQKDAEIASLQELYRLAQLKRFGKSAEGYVGQDEVFNEAEEIVEEVKAQEKSTSAPRKKPVRKPLPKDLPREQVLHDIEDKSCACCGNELHKIGEDVSEKLEFIPAQVKVIEHIRPKYACRHCEKNDTQTPIKQAKMPAMPIAKGIATPSLLSQIIISKYQYGIPLYRQESMFKQCGIDLSRQTMSQWIIRCADMFEPLIALLKEHLLEQPVIFSDDTTLQVVSLDRGKSYMWVYGSGADGPQTTSNILNIVLYDFTESHVHSHAKDYLEGYQGYLQVDGFEGYEKTEAILAGCWAHARRYFVEAKKLHKKKGKADEVLSLIQELYAVEATIKEKSPQEKYQVRQARSKPILQKLAQWLEQNQPNLVGNTRLSKAANYMANQWDKLTRYVEDGCLAIDNNRAERAIKPFVIGRKAWLFSNTVNGAKASAILYSIVETAKANGLVPYDYIMLCLEELCQPKPDLNRLLPWNISIPKK